MRCFGHQINLETYNFLVVVLPPHKTLDVMTTNAFEKNVVKITLNHDNFCVALACYLSRESL